MTKTEAYHIFGLLENQVVSADLLKNRYRILTKTYHPDNPRTGSEEMMTKVNVAFQALSNNEFDPEDAAAPQSAANSGTGFEGSEKGFDVNFDPFDFEQDFAYDYFVNEARRAAESREGQESAYENSYENESEEQEYYDDSYGDDYEDGYGQEEEEQYEQYEKPPKPGKRRKRRGPVSAFFLLIGKLCKLIIALCILACFAGAVVAIIYFGFNRRGMVVAAGVCVMGLLGILVYRFFGELIS